MVARLKQEWFQDLFVATGEVDADAVAELRRLQEVVSRETLVPAPAGPPASSSGGADAEGSRHVAPAVAGAREISEELLSALEWATGVKDLGVLLVIAEDLEPALRDEQVHKYRSRELRNPAEPSQENA